MQPSPSSIAAWRWGIVLLAILAAVEFTIDVFHAPRVVSQGVRGAPLFEGHFVRERGPTRFVVESIPPSSPLASLGVVPGDLLQWDEPVGRWHNLAAGDRVSLTTFHGGEARRIEVAVPAEPALPRHTLATYATSHVLQLGALVMGLLIGWRRPDLAAYRGLAASALLLANDFPYSAPASAHLEWLDFLASVSQEISLPTLLFFAINYPDDKPVGLRAQLKRFYPWIFGALVVAALFYYARLYSGSFEPGFRWIARTTSVAIPVLFLGTIVLAWRQSRGEARVRLNWILATLGTIIGAALVGNLNFLMGFPVVAEEMGLALNAVTLAAFAGLVYATLRRRIFDFGLAVNRTLVFAIVGAILLGAFQIVHHIAGEFLRFDDKNKTLVLSAVLAIAVYLSFDRLKKIVERVVDRLLFSSWAMSEDGLKRFAREASHVSDADALAGLLVAAIDRFTRNAGCAVYRAGSPFTLAGGTLDGVPVKVDGNDETVLSLRAHDKALRMRDDAPLRATLALPMAHRGGLVGFVLVGPQRNGDPYRPDQIDALESAVHKVGLDFYALRIEQLEVELRVERETSHTLRAQLDLAVRMSKRSSD